MAEKPFADYWARIRGRNKSLKDSELKMTLTVDEFRRQLARAFKAGQDSRQKDKLDFAEIFKWGS